MKNLRRLILVFLVALSIPLGFFIHKTQEGLDQEEEDALRYFGEMLFNQIEDELTDFVQREERRAIDHYHVQASWADEGSGHSSSFVDGGVGPKYIVGYLQNNPDGSFVTPLTAGDRPVSPDQEAVVNRLASVNEAFNRIRTTEIDKTPPPFPHGALTTRSHAPAAPPLEGGYLFVRISRTQKSHLGRDEKRVQNISIQQVMKMSPKVDDPARVQADFQPDNMRASMGDPPPSDPTPMKDVRRPTAPPDDSIRSAGNDVLRDSRAPTSSGAFLAEVAPLQAVILEDSDIFVFRRIEINNRMYRQGVVLNTEGFLQHLVDAHFADQPMARFTNLTLGVKRQDRDVRILQAGIPSVGSKFKIERTFPRPFSFLNATLSCDQIPRSRGRRTMSAMIGLTGLVIVIGLFTIYHSARTVMDMSERRTTFVSSVTHELKTPLTNIRMYVEMLEQGIAGSPEREQAYFGILESESSRLSRLINNVLEFSKLEKKQRHVNMREGDFTDVLNEVQVVMRQKLLRENFEIRIENRLTRSFAYDREVMIQVLTNLVENSIKFGREEATKIITIGLEHRGGCIVIRVSDTGPGIPRKALKKVFDEFYRVDNSLTRKTGGTGIGLALVKKFVTAMGGTVRAFNNEGTGCTIEMELPEG